MTANEGVDRPSARVVFDAICEVVTEDATRESGRVLVGPGQVVVAVPDGRHTLRSDHVFDVVVTGEQPFEVTVGFESAEERRAFACRFDESAVGREFYHAVFVASLSGRSVRVSRDGTERDGRFEVGDEACRVRFADAVTTIDAVVGLRLHDDGHWIRVRHRARGENETVSLAFETSWQRNLAGRYLRTLRVSAPDVSERGPNEIRVLLVDDDVGFAELASDFLTHEHDDIDFEIATGADEGLARLGRSPQIDCVVSDYRMPGTDGVSFLKQVRRRGIDIPFLLFTGRGDETVAAEALRAGVTDYIKKRATSAQFAFLADRIREAVEDDAV